MVFVDFGEISARNPSSTLISRKRGKEIHGLLVWDDRTEEQGDARRKPCEEPLMGAQLSGILKASGALGCYGLWVYWASGFTVYLIGSNFMYLGLGILGYLFNWVRKCIWANFSLLFGPDGV
ncbi:hypothetical protein ERO13_A04G015200v2 [Gossypium hirsutum]|nr:hypothetical protein ERO13_A04G015200v2 [Gossypium hirsutum]